VRSNQLPGFWHESIIKFNNKDKYIFGISIPGIPYVMMGRTKNLAYTFTYGNLKTF
jgi:penicillin G amidase